MRAIRELIEISNYVPTEGALLRLYELAKVTGMNRKEVQETIGTTGYFRVLYKQLKDELMKEMVENAILSCSDYYQEFLQISKKCLQVEALLHSGKRAIGIKYADEVLKSSEKLELIENSLNLSRELANHYAVIQPNRAKFKKYRAKVSQYDKYLSDEVAAHMAYIELGLSARTGGKIVRFKEVLEDLKRRAKDNKNYRFSLFYFSTQQLYCKLRKDKIGIRNTCEEALEFFNKKNLKIMPFTVMFGFYFDLIPSLIEEKNYALAEKYLRRSIETIPEGTYNYHLALLLFAMLGFASRKKGLVADAIRKGEEREFSSDDIQICWDVVGEGYREWDVVLGWEERIFELLYEKD